jgi:adenosylcobinamide-GDP ribazoletransferase
LKFLAALSFLTVIPMPRRRVVSPEQLGSSIVCFPVVGIIVGLILAGLYWLLRLVLPPAVVSGLLLICLVVLTGGLHLDGFADTCDGIASRQTPEARREVMRDSRAGALGMVGVCCLLIVKYVSLNSVPENLMMMTLVLMPVVSRWAMVYAIFAHPYARPSGLGKVFKQATSRRRLAIATLVALAVVFALARLPGFVIMLGVWAIVVAMAAYLEGKFSGLTGDTYGAINEVAEVSVLILVCLLAYNHWLGLA